MSAMQLGNCLVLHLLHQQVLLLVPPKLINQLLHLLFLGWGEQQPQRQLLVVAQLQEAQQLLVQVLQMNW